MSLSRGKILDVSPIGRTKADLPGLADHPAASRFDIRQWWPAERRDRPCELEIGSGKGTFLVQQAAARPDVNYLGIEYIHPIWRYAADRLRRHQLANTRLLCYDAAVFVRWYCPDGLFDQVHIYFPDPWPKKKHHKRRLLRAEFLADLHRILTDRGRVRLVTDHDDYFAWINEQIAQVADRFAVEPFENPDSARPGEIVGTNFERKYRREGRPFHALTLRRR